MMKNRFPTVGDLAAVGGVFLILQLLVAGVLTAPMMLSGASKEMTLTVVYFSSIVPAILFAVFYRGGREGRKPEFKPGWNFRADMLPLLGWGIVLMLSVAVVLEPLLALFPKEWFAWLDDAIGRGPWAVLTTVVMAPLLEEMFFRGAVQGPAVERFGPWRGILASAALFGVIHLVPMQVINALAIGIVLGYIYYRTRSLIPVIIMHSVNNGLSYWTMAHFESAETLREVVPTGELYWSLYALCSAVVLLGAAGMARHLGKKSGKA